MKRPRRCCVCNKEIPKGYKCKACRIQPPPRVCRDCPTILTEPYIQRCEKHRAARVKHLRARR